MGSSSNFHGVVCSSIDQTKSLDQTITKLLSLTETSTYEKIKCYNLELKNKYYQTTIHLIDYNDLKLSNKHSEVTNSEIKQKCYAVILYGDGQKLSTDQLDQQIQNLDWVSGEPRIFVCEGIDADCPSHRTYLDWSIKNGYDFMLADDIDISEQIIGSLSAYRWPHRLDVNSQFENEPNLNDDTIKKLVEFDKLLEKINAYKEKPELRGNPDDSNIEEIAQLLSNLLGEDSEDFASSLE